MEERKGNFTMNRRTTEISQCELTVMKCIWDLKAETGEVTCAQVMEKLKEDYGLTYKDTTVYTFLKNLINKGFVSSEKKGITYYTPIRKEEDYRTDLLKQSKKFWFNDSVADFVEAVFKLDTITAEDKKKIKGLIK